MKELFPISPRIREEAAAAEAQCAPIFQQIDQVAEYNSNKVLEAFIHHRVSEACLKGSTGYGYDDMGRDTLDKVFARVFGCEAALVRHNFVSGTHALVTALFGVLRPGDRLVACTGKPYDTLEEAIGIRGHGQGSLTDFGVEYTQLELLGDGTPDLEAIAKAASYAKMIYIQRSRGYSLRPSLSVETIGRIAQAAKAVNPDVIVMVDNCYGEFVEEQEPTQVGADLMAGSLIKNPGGGIAPTGGYIAGRHDLVEKCSHRLTCPGTGRELGCTLDTLRQMYLGLYYAPGVTAEALKTSVYASCLLENLGYRVTPRWQEDRNDIITSVYTGSAEALCALCQGIQAGSPVDSFVTPEPYAMPGYTSQVIMAAGAFTLGSSIELSCDAPVREPYIAYLQGGLNFAASRAGVLLGVQRAFFDNK